MKSLISNLLCISIAVSWTVVQIPSSYAIKCKDVVAYPISFPENRDWTDYNQQLNNLDFDERIRNFLHVHNEYLKPDNEVIPASHNYKNIAQISLYEGKISFPEMRLRPYLKLPPELQKLIKTELVESDLVFSEFNDVSPLPSLLFGINRGMTFADGVHFTERALYLHDFGHSFTAFDGYAIIFYRTRTLESGRFSYSQPRSPAEAKKIVRRRIAIYQGMKSQFKTPRELELFHRIWFWMTHENHATLSRVTEWVDLNPRQFTGNHLTIADLIEKCGINWWSHTACSKVSMTTYEDLGTVWEADAWTAIDDSSLNGYVIKGLIKNSVEGVMGTAPHLSFDDHIAVIKTIRNYLRSNGLSATELR